MLHSLIRLVIQVDEERFPFCRKCFIVNGIAMILRSDEGPVGPHLQDRLVVAAVPILELVGLGASGKRHELVAQANPEDGLVGGEGFLQVCDGHVASLRVARAIRQEQTVI